MSIKSFERDLSELRLQLERMGNSAPLVLARSLNRAAIAGQTATVKAIAADTGIQQKSIRREMQIEKATVRKPLAAVEVQGQRIPLIAFSARGPEPSRGRGRGVSYRLPGGRGRVPNAFIATVGAGHRGVFVRRGKSRSRKGKPSGSPGLPIKELRGPSIPHVFEKFFPTFQKAAEESLVKNLRHEIDFANRPTGSPVTEGA